jgi:O-antigen ligase
MILVLSIHFGAGRLRHNYLIGNAFERLDNAVTLNFSKDEAIMERETVQWPEATSLASRNYFGIGPGRVTPSASQAVNYVAPHNNYMFYYLGYGFPGLALFLLMLVLILIQLSRMCHSRKYFGYGMVASYCAMAVFNLPFLGKIGMWFFLVAGFLLNSHENQAGQT